MMGMMNEADERKQHKQMILGVNEYGNQGKKMITR